MKVRDIFKTSDKKQLIRNADDILGSLNPTKLRELQDNNPSITNLQRNRKTSVKGDEKNILRYAVDIKDETIQAILLPKAIRPCIIASCRGVIIMTKAGGLLLSMFIASSMSGWSGCFYLSVSGRPVSA